MLTIEQITGLSPTDEALTKAQPDTMDFAIMGQASRGNGWQSGCAVTPQGSPNNTVAVSQGNVIVNGISYLVLAANVTILANSGTTPRRDLVIFRVGSGLMTLSGTSANFPFTALPGDGAGGGAGLNFNTDVVLASVYVKPSFSTITSTEITDKRPPTAAGATGVYYADMYGADPTGVEDSTPAINTIIANAQTLSFGAFTGPNTARPVCKIILGVGVYNFGASGVDIVQGYNWVRVEGQGESLTRCFYYGANQLGLNDGQTGLSIHGPAGGGAALGVMCRAGGGWHNLTMDGSFSMAGATGWSITTGHGWDAYIGIHGFGPCPVPFVVGTTTGGTNSNSLATGTYGVRIAVAGSPSLAPLDGMACAEQQVVLGTGQGTIAVALPGWQTTGDMGVVGPPYGYNIYFTPTAGSAWRRVASNVTEGTVYYIDGSITYGSLSTSVSGNTSVGLTLNKGIFLEKINLRGRITSCATGVLADGANASNNPGSFADCLLDFYFNVPPEGTAVQLQRGAWLYNGFLRMRGNVMPSNQNKPGYALALVSGGIKENGHTDLMMETDHYPGSNFYTLDTPQSGVNVTTFNGTTIQTITVTGSTASANNQASSRLWVQTSTGAALISYSNVSGHTFTGCTYISGSGTLATGGAVVDVGNPYAASPITVNEQAPHWMYLDNADHAAFRNEAFKISLRSGNLAFADIVSTATITNGSGGVQSFSAAQWTGSGDIEASSTTIPTLGGVSSPSASVPYHLRVQDFVT